MRAATTPDGGFEPGSSDALVDPATSHLVDERRPGLVISRTDSPVVYLSPARRRLLADSVRRGETLVLVSGEGTALTPAYREAASLVRARWAVEGPHGVRDAIIGRRLGEPADIVSTRPGMDRAPEHARAPGDDLAAQVLVSCSIRHRNAGAAPFGAAAAALATALRPGCALRWGVSEPLTEAWDEEGIAAYLRSRIRQGPWAFLAGQDADGDAIAMTIRVRATKQGAEEIISAVAGVPGPPGAEAADRAGELGEDALDAVSEAGLALFGTAFSRFGRRDLLTAPAIEPPAFPTAMLLGPPALRRLDGRPEAIAERARGELVGEPRRPGLLIPVGAGMTPAAFPRVAEGLWALGPVRLSEVIGEEPVASLLGRGWREEAARRAAADPDRDAGPVEGPSRPDEEGGEDVR